MSNLKVFRADDYYKIAAENNDDAKRLYLADELGGIDFCD